MYILDTNICIYSMKNKFSKLTAKLLQVNPKKIFISSITVGELEYGAAKSKWESRSRQALNLFLSAYTILPFDEEDARIFGKLRALLNSQGKPIGPYDLQIASQGLAKDKIIITHNVKEFNRVPNLRVEDWVK